ncbi:unnamed protein product [Pleuronectes platessa]|uniref:Uncharacterized protein n=1 Tax=Pleuronectes platessa TaxID=8262 RepID=A0A9N7VDB2_PLEPL|nr:unnamed protein product [Pleuronectes platessa]
MTSRECPQNWERALQRFPFHRNIINTLPVNREEDLLLYSPIGSFGHPVVFYQGAGQRNSRESLKALALTCVFTCSPFGEWPDALLSSVQANSTSHFPFPGLISSRLLHHYH